MRQTTDAARSHIDFARISPGIGDELGNGLRGERWSDGQYGRRSRNTRNWSNVANQVEIERVVERCVPHVGRRRFEQRVTVGGRPHDHIGRQITARTWLIVDDDFLAEALRQRWRYRTRENVR